MLIHTCTIQVTNWAVVSPSIGKTIGKGKTEQEAKARAFDWITEHHSYLTPQDFNTMTVIKNDKD